jgi:hypothetical protein
MSSGGGPFAPSGGGAGKTRLAMRAANQLTENDGVLPPAFQESLAVRSGAEIVRIPHGHAPFQEDPAGFADLLERVADLSSVAG